MTQRNQLDIARLPGENARRVRAQNLGQAMVTETAEAVATAGELAVETTEEVTGEIISRLRRKPPKNAKEAAKQRDDIERLRAAWCGVNRLLEWSEIATKELLETPTPKSRRTGGG